MDRITQKDLECQVKHLNEITGHPTAAWQKQPDGSYKSIEGVYVLDWAYGGVELQQIMNTGGGVHCVSGGGHGTKRELYTFLNAYISGIGIGKTE